MFIKHGNTEFYVDLRSFARQVSQPTLILHGDADTILPLESSRWLVSKIPECQFRVIHDAGHVPTVTRPDEVVDAINQYFQDRPA